VIARRIAAVLGLAGLVPASGVLAADALDYGLKPERIAADTYVLRGREEDYSFRNGGNIVNTGFIVTRDGVVVIDTGPSKRYGEQMRAAIARVTDRPVAKVFNTHHHPDHYFGNQAYGGLPIAALPPTIAAMKAEGGGFADNVYRLSGDWLKGTEPEPANQAAAPGRITIGGHDLELIALKGHTVADLAVFDRTTGVLFAGDLVFYQRAATTPHASLKDWLAALDALQKLPFRKMVPGHGPVIDDARGIEQTRRYLAWLGDTLAKAAEQGLDMAEVLALPIPAEFASIPLVRGEFERSVSHLFRGYEAQALGRPAR
jgi:uncharacterized sulfatase